MFHNALHDRLEDTHVVVIVYPVLQGHVYTVVTTLSSPDLG